MSIVGETSLVIVKGIARVYLDGLGEFLNACTEIDVGFVVTISNTGRARPRAEFYNAKFNVGKARFVMLVSQFLARRCLSWVRSWSRCRYWRVSRLWGWCRSRDWLGWLWCSNRLRQRCICGYRCGGVDWWRGVSWNRCVRWVWSTSGLCFYRR